MKKFISLRSLCVPILIALLGCTAAVSVSAAGNTTYAGVALDKSVVVLKNGGSGSLSVISLPAETPISGLVWSSDDTSVVKVKNGKLHATGIGSATVTVSTPDGSYRAACTVNVTKDGSDPRSSGPGGMPPGMGQGGNDRQGGPGGNNRKGGNQHGGPGGTPPGMGQGGNGGQGGPGGNSGGNDKSSKKNKKNRTQAATAQNAQQQQQGAAQLPQNQQNSQNQQGQQAQQGQFPPQAAQQNSQNSQNAQQQQPPQMPQQQAQQQQAGGNTQSGFPAQQNAQQQQQPQQGGPGGMMPPPGGFGGNGQQGGMMPAGGGNGGPGGMPQGGPGGMGGPGGQGGGMGGPGGGNGQQGGPGGMGGGSGSDESSATDPKGYVQTKGETVLSGKTFSSSTADANAVKVSGGKLTLNDCKMAKTSGDSSNADGSSFYGTNSGVLANKKGEITINGGMIKTNAIGANGIVAYGGTVNVSNTKIRCETRLSRGIHATGGGKITARNLDIATKGPNSSVIALDRGGGTVTVYGGTYSCAGQDSAVMYSTGDLTVNSIKGSSKLGEICVIEGDNIVAINNSDVTSHASANSRGMMILQSGSGDAGTGLNGVITVAGGSLTMTDKDASLIEIVTNVTGKVTLDGVKTTIPSGILMTVDYNRRWQTYGATGILVLNGAGTTYKGDIVADSYSSAKITVNEGVIWSGAIDKADTAKATTLTLNGGTWNLTADSNVDSITLSGNAVINQNGHKLNCPDIKKKAGAGTVNK